MDHLIPIINSINEEIFDIIIYNSESPLADKPDGAKKKLLEMIMDCPATNILRMITLLKDLSFILFDNPQFTGVRLINYLSVVYFKRESIALSTIEAVLHRISTLTIEDFKTIGLGDKLNDEDLKALKEHAKVAVSDWVKKYERNSYVGVGTTYRTKELRDLQFETFRALWKAVAHRENNFFLSYSIVAEAFGLSKDYFTQKISKPKMMTDTSAKRLVGKLNNFIVEESYLTPLSYGGIVNMGPSQYDNAKIQDYSKAIDKLIQYREELSKAKEAWTKNKAISWFDNLFEPSSDFIYSKGFASGEGLYKSWLNIMGLFELFGTDPMSGEAIPNSAFDKNDEDAEQANHHMESGNKMSNALYDIILTWDDYHKIPYESFSKLNGIYKQRLLKYRLRKLFELGINKIEDDVQNEQWITITDFKAMFPNNLEYKVKYKGTTYKGSLYYLWNDVFTRESFQDKLGLINDKITRYRKARNKGLNPHIEWLSGFHPAAKSRFLKKASKFADRFWMLGSEHRLPISRKSSHRKADELAYIWQVYLMKKAFDLD